ncbi:hypothetical protein Gotur_027957, partial [Gossypium turneri]
GFHGSAATALLVSLNLLFFSMANADITTLTQSPNYNVNVCVDVLRLGAIPTKDGPTLQPH